MSDRWKIAKFKQAVGFDDVPGINAKDGVWADWRLLPEFLAPELGGLRLFCHQMHAVKTGVGLAEWTWRRRRKQISIDLFVCGDTAGARQRLLQLETDTTTVEAPVVPALEKVGELAIEHKDRTGHDLDWVYRNICVSVENDDTGPNVIAIARRIQSFLAAHTVPNIAAHIPRVASIDLSPSSIRSGDTFEVRLRFPDGVDLAKLTIDVRPGTWPPLEPLDQNGSVFTVKALKAGRAELEIIALDPVSLLSAKAGVVIDVLPGP